MDLWELVTEQFEDHILRILLVAAAAALIVGVAQHGWRSGWVEGLAIYMAVCIIVTVTAGNNYMKEKQFQKLFSKATQDYVAVFRGNEGMTTTVPG
jgi:Ca2+ transporting ATPase